MATRLYPNTESAATLEALADVPAGTMEILKALRVQAAELDGEAAWALVDGHPTAGRLDHFLTFGWGRVKCIDAMQGLGLDPWCGSTSDPDAVARICKAQQISEHTILILQETGGVCWN